MPTRTSRGSRFFRGVYKHVLSAVARRRISIEGRCPAPSNGNPRTGEARGASRRDISAEARFFRRADKRAKSDSWATMRGRFPVARRVSPVDNRVRSRGSPRGAARLSSTTCLRAVALVRLGAVASPGTKRYARWRQRAGVRASRHHALHYNISKKRLSDVRLTDTVHHAVKRARQESGPKSRGRPLFTIVEQTDRERGGK